MHALHDCRGDPQRPVAAPTETAARSRFNHNHAGFVLKQPANRIDAETPSPRDVCNGVMLLQRRRLGRHLDDLLF